MADELPQMVPTRDESDVERIEGPACPARYCVTCDYDRHYCPGCGESLDHYTLVCQRCVLDYKLAPNHIISNDTFPHDDLNDSANYDPDDICGCSGQ